MSAEYVKQAIEKYFTLSFTLREILMSDTDLISKKDLLRQIETSLSSYGLSYEDYQQVLATLALEDIISCIKE